jgi:hypothetical protein
MKVPKIGSNFWGGGGVDKIKNQDENSKLRKKRGEGANVVESERQ